MRIEKINQVIKQELAKIIQKHLDLKYLSTITKVATSKDLNQCKVFVSVFPEKELENTLKILQKHAYILHQELNKKMFIRRVPKIVFKQDREPKVNKVLDNL